MPHQKDQNVFIIKRSAHQSPPDQITKKSHFQAEILSVGLFLVNHTVSETACSQRFPFWSMHLTMICHGAIDYSIIFLLAHHQHSLDCPTILSESLAPLPFSIGQGIFRIIKMKKKSSNMNFIFQVLNIEKFQVIQKEFPFRTLFIQQKTEQYRFSYQKENSKLYHRLFRLKGLPFSLNSCSLFSI